MTEKEVHWSEKTAEKLIKLFPKNRSFVCAGGITPSGTVHIGNFRDIITSDIISRILREKKFNGKLLFFWDDYDRLRKVPSNIPESFSEHIGMSISDIPDPYKCHKFYAEHFKKEFEEAIPELGIKPKFISQKEEYGKNKYLEEIKTALKKRKEIAKILSEFKTQKFSEEQIENYYPLQVYCSKCKKDTTIITDYDGNNSIAYSCRCGFSEEADLSKKNIGKLSWKVDWAARWHHYGTCFEPGGKDHATVGGSYDVSSKIAKEVFGIKPPLFEGYEFVGIRGNSKMSSSSGTGISPKNLLEIYEPELLRWLFTRVNPKREITFCFDSELIRQYDEFDREIEEYFSNKLSASRKKAIMLSRINREFSKKRVPFRQLVSFGQISQGNITKLKEMFRKIGQEFDEKSLEKRLRNSENWVKNFAGQFEIKIRENPNKGYYNKLDDEEKEQIIALRENIEKNFDIESLTSLVYRIPKKENISEEETKKRQRIFFRNMYQMLIDSDTGPRLPTFLLVLGKEKVRRLLNLI